MEIQRKRETIKVARETNKTCNSKTEIITDELLWKNIKQVKIEEYIDKIKYLLLEFGTKELCNRFDVGNVIEFIIAELINSTGYNVEELPNAKRIDLCINGNYNLSIKYSSVGDITLHNSNRCINKDLHLTDLLLLTTSQLYLITNKELQKNNIDVNQYIKNTGDGLKLQRKILKVLENKKYPFIIEFNITIDKKVCKNRLCSKVFYNSFMIEYKLSK
jgi:hypothetical protein